MNEKEFAQIVLEMRAAHGQALALLTQALCQQIDPKKLKADLQGFISSAKQMPGTSPLAIQIAMHAMAAAEAESALQRTRPGG